MSNFVLDGTAIPNSPKSDLNTLGTLDPTKVIQAGDWNALVQALSDIRTKMPTVVDTIANLQSTIPPQNVTSVLVKGYSSPGDGGEGLFTWISGSSAADDGGTVLASTAAGAPSGRWFRWHTVGYFDTAWFGAVDSTGATDVSVQLQRAHDAAAASGLLPGTGTPATVHTGKGTWLIGDANTARFGDAYGGVQVYSHTRVTGDGPATWFIKKAGLTNYMFRALNVVDVEFSDLTVDQAVDTNYRVSLYFQYCSNVRVRRVTMTTSVRPGGTNWTPMGVLCYNSDDVVVEDCVQIRCQVKLLGSKNHYRRNIAINPYNPCFSWVVGGGGVNMTGCYVLDNYIEGAADAALFVGQDTGVTGSTFTDVQIKRNTINGFFANRGILARLGTSQKDWDFSDNTVRGGGYASTPVATSTSTTGTFAALPAWQATHAYTYGDRVTNGGNIYDCLTAGTSAGAGGPTTTALDITDGTVHWRWMGAGSTSGSLYPASGWGYLDLGTQKTELVEYTRSGDVLTYLRATTHTHANGCEFWALTGNVVQFTLGIEVQAPADNVGGPLTGLRIDNNRVENVDVQGINVVAGVGSLLHWSISGNRIYQCRGIALSNVGATALWGQGDISRNNIDCYTGIAITSAGGVHGEMLLQGNNFRGDGVAGNNGNGLIVNVAAGTTSYRACGNVFTNAAGFAADGCGIKELGAGTIVHDVQANDLSGNTQNTLIGTGMVRHNKGYVTEAKGTAQINSGSTSVVVTHGLSVTPSAQDIAIVPTALSTTDPGEIYADTFTSTQFTVRCRTNPGASNLPFAWRAQVV